MPKASTPLTVAAILFMIFSGRPALAGSSVAIGVNIFDEGAISQAEQDAELQQLENNGVKTIRTGLGNSSVYVITEAFKHGIGTVAIVYPFYGSKAKSMRYGPTGNWRVGRGRRLARRRRAVLTSSRYCRARSPGR